MSVRQLQRQGLPERAARRLVAANVRTVQPGTYYATADGRSYLFTEGDELLAFLSTHSGPVRVCQIKEPT